MRTLFVLALAIAAMHLAASAEEGGAGHYAPGILASIVDLPPSDPGLRLQSIALRFDGSASTVFAVPGLGDVPTDLEVTTNAETLAALYTFDERIFGAFYTVGAFVPFVDTKVTTTAATPLGEVVSVDRESGVGDITIVPALLSWRTGDVRYGFGLPIYVPTGAYDDDRLANAGRNYWTADPFVSLSYNSSTTGLNAALFAGMSINSENQATDYQSGALVHVEATVQQLLPLGPGFVGIGANAFWLEQVTDDSGPGANRGAFRGRSIGIGPTLDYVLPIDDAIAVLEFRWLPEIETRNRVKGDYFWLKGVLQF